MEKISLRIDETTKIAQLTLQSPPANALSRALLTDIDRALDRIEEKIDVIKAVIVHGAGRFFSAGADIKEFTTLETKEQFTDLGRFGQQVFDRIEAFPIPVIAAIHGAALGGGLELALACHMRFVTKNAKLGLPESTLGIIPGFGGTQRLPNIVGKHKAYQMMLTGESITGEDAHMYRLANDVVDEDEEVLEKAYNVAKKISEKSKPTIEDVIDLVALYEKGAGKEGFAEEALRFGQSFMKEDAKEGIEAFIEKRKPTFHDR